MFYFFLYIYSYMFYTVAQWPSDSLLTIGFYYHSGILLARSGKNQMQHYSTRNVLKIGRKVWTECLNTWFFIPVYTAYVFLYAKRKPLVSSAFPFLVNERKSKNTLKDEKESFVLNIKLTRIIVKHRPSVCQISLQLVGSIPLRNNKLFSFSSSRW